MARLAAADCLQDVRLQETTLPSGPVARYTGALERVLRWEVSGLEGVNGRSREARKAPE